MAKAITKNGVARMLLYFRTRVENDAKGIDHCLRLYGSAEHTRIKKLILTGKLSCEHGLVFMGGEGELFLKSEFFSGAIQ